MLRVRGSCTLLLTAVALANVTCGPSGSSTTETRTTSLGARGPLATVDRVTAQSTPLSEVFDDDTARELMRLRREFDDAELAAIREFDDAIGSASVRVAIPIGHYRNQLATREMAEDRWTPEQKRRSARAWPARQKRIDVAEALFSTRTATVLKPFGFKEDRLPPVRRRKYDGPPVYGFNSFRGNVPKESRALLQEVRRLWSLSVRQPR
jgi:hypothetical protein